MSPRRLETTDLEAAIVQSIDLNKAPNVPEIAQQFGVSRETVYARLREMEQAGIVSRTGKGKATKFELVETVTTKNFSLEKLEEHEVWDRFVQPLLTGFSKNDLNTCSYGVTEMINNAIDHSDGSTLSVSVTRSVASTMFLVADDGVGIFQKIIKAFDLSEPRHAILELAKGKLTTDPERHSGEGIFFTSRVFDIFTIRSGDLTYIHDLNDGWFIQSGTNIDGTVVMMFLRTPSARTLSSVFGQFSSGPEEYRFSKTHVPISLIQYGDGNLISRSQAKRVLSRFDRFDEVWIDFDGVEEIGQAFADEIFRVFQNAHPEIRIIATNTSAEVNKMIARAQSRD